MTPRIALLGLLLGAPIQAQTIVADFESDADLDAWHDEGGTAITALACSLEAAWATAGSQSLCISSPKWHGGMPEWPAVEFDPPITDWSGHDRLVIDITNPTDYPQKLICFIADTKVPTRESYQWRVELAPLSYKQVSIVLRDVVQAGVDLTDIARFHFFTERPAGDMKLYVDRFTLLPADEAAPVPQPEFVTALAAMQHDRLDALKREQAEIHVRVREAAADTPEVAEWADGLLDGLVGRLDGFLEDIRAGDPSVLSAAEVLSELRDSALHIESLVKLRLEFEDVRQEVQSPDSDRGDVAVGFASPMEKVLPRAGVPDLRPSTRARISLARNEKEAIQVVVVPTDADAKAVSLRVSDLKGPGGAILSSGSIDAPPVGYVETKARPPYGTSHIGWWPDPILDFMTEADIAQGDAQSFWLRVRCPEDQLAGAYTGDLEVLVDGATVHTFELSVTVYPFAVPKRSPLDSAITWAPHHYKPVEGGGWDEGPIEDQGWREHKLEWADFLADYYITSDSLYDYADWDVDFEVIEHLAKQGRLGRFNLGYYGVLGESEEDREAWLAEIRARIGPRFERAKELGLLDHAYIYGCDEHPEALFPGVERAAAEVKKEFPDVFVFTTTYDHSFGTESPLKSMDGFCPLTPRYDKELADDVRAKGQQVWWYICCGPHHPHANMFVEYPAIDGRILMGAQTAKFRPDGFLYYQTSIWNSGPITDGPFTDWDPRSWTTYHGDGSWTCLGPDSTPLATIRLENYRDGLEDYAYAKLLEEAILTVEATQAPTDAQRAWLSDAKAALEVPARLVESMTEYTAASTDVYRWRRAMAKALSSVPAQYFP